MENYLNSLTGLTQQGTNCYMFTSHLWIEQKFHWIETQIVWEFLLCASFEFMSMLQAVAFILKMIIYAKFL